MNELGTPREVGLLVVIELSPPLDATETKEALLEAMAEEFGERLRELGVERRPEFQVRPGDGTRAVRIRVQDRAQRFSPEMMKRAWLMVASSELADVPFQPARPSPDGFPDGWFRDFVEDLPALDETKRAVAVRFIGRLAMETVLDRPECLLGPDQLETLGGELSRSPSRSHALLCELFYGLLRAGPLPPPAAIAKALAEGEERHDSIEYTIEALVAAHRDDRMEIRVSLADLRAVAPGYVDGNPLSAYAPEVSQEARGAFEQMEKALYSDLGVRIPDPVLQEDPGMPAGMLRLRVNGRLSPPLSFRIPLLAEAVGLELRRRPELLLGIEEVEYQLAVLYQTFPELVSAALEQLQLGDLTRVLRGLLEEGVSIIDLRAILERLLQFDTIRVDADRYVVLDDRLPISTGRPDGEKPTWRQRLEHVRSGSGIRNWMTKQLGRRQIVAKNVRVIQIAEVLEHEVRRNEKGMPDDELAEEEAQDAILDAVWRLLPTHSADDGGIALLVGDPLARARVRRLIAGELPDLPVIVSSQLRPDVRILPTLPGDREPGDEYESDVSIVDDDALTSSATSRGFRRLRHKASRSRGPG